MKILGKILVSLGLLLIFYSIVYWFAKGGPSTNWGGSEFGNLFLFIFIVVPSIFGLIFIVIGSILIKFSRS